MREHGIRVVIRDERCAGKPIGVYFKSAPSHHCSNSFEFPKECLGYCLPPGSYIGEGFDDSEARCVIPGDAHFVARNVQQYVGRLHEVHHGKKLVRVFDYVDARVPMLARMFEKRLRGYRAIG